MSRPPDEPEPGKEPPSDRQDEPAEADTGSPAGPGRQEPPPPPYPQAPPPWSYQQAPPQAPPGMPPPFPPAPAPRGAPPAEPPAERDRLAVHLIWEGALAVITLVLVAGTLAMTPHQNLTVSLTQAGALGLVAVGLAFSLRTGSPNLAVGSILTFTSSLGAYLATEQDWGTPAALIVAILLATFIGFVLGLLVALLSVPAWAVTLAAATFIQSLALWVTGARTILMRIGDGYPTALWFTLFTLLSVGGGALWLVPAVRRPFSAGRRSGEPGRWAGLQPGLGAVAGLTGSSFLAALAAVPLLMRLQAADVGIGQNMTVVAFAAVLLGGVSVFGRRAGVFGTFLGVMILAITQTLLAYNGVSAWVSSLIVGLLALAGLGVSRGLESVTDMLNRTRPAAGAPRPAPPAAPAPSAAG
ncbi:ABC transporter permease [Actinomadura scrupuli]|uniref:ABC transporter permease n=1 Tax=Actinomadura scrupuli TaxID=559629 RepID=UPI003D992A5A